MLGSGNLGLVYLMEERRRLTLEEMEGRHPTLLPALRSHPHGGWLLVRSSKHGAIALGGGGAGRAHGGAWSGRATGRTSGLARALEQRLRRAASFRLSWRLQGLPIVTTFLVPSFVPT